MIINLILCGLIFIGAGTVGYFVVNRGLKIYDKWRAK